MKKLIVGLMNLVLFAGIASAAGNFVHDSRSVAYFNTSSAIVAGNLVDLGDRYGVALVNIASNATGTVQIDGVWSFARYDTNAIAAGAAVYCQTASNVTGTAAADKYVGQCTEAVAVCAALTNSVGELNKFVKVDINAPERQCIVGVDVQAYSANLANDAGVAGVSKTNTIALVGSTQTVIVIYGKITSWTSVP